MNDTSDHLPAPLRAANIFMEMVTKLADHWEIHYGQKMVAEVNVNIGTLKAVSTKGDDFMMVYIRNLEKMRESEKGFEEIPLFVTNALRLKDLGYEISSIDHGPSIAITVHRAEENNDKED